MELPESNYGKSKPVIEAALDEEEEEEEEPLAPIDCRLVDAVQNKVHGSTVIWMELNIQEFLSTDLQNIKFPPLNSYYLRDIASILANHYGLEIIGFEGTRLNARRTPASRQPLITLCSISPVEPEDETSVNFEFIEASTNSKIQSVGTSSSNFDELESMVTTVEERDEEYYKARGRNCNESVPPGSTSAVVSRSTSDPVHGTMVRDGGQDGASGRRTTRNPVHNSGSNLNLNQDTLLYLLSMTESELIQYYLDPNRTTALPSLLTSPGCNLNNPTSYTYIRLSTLQSKQPLSLEPMQQPRTEAAQPPSTSVAVQNQFVDNVPHQRGDDETARSARQRSLQKFLANRSKKKPE